jgi:hypothetical protein
MRLLQAVNRWFDISLDPCEAGAIPGKMQRNQFVQTFGTDAVVAKRKRGVIRGWSQGIWAW